MPWQNEAEQELKHMVNLIMDFTGSPNHHWIMRSLYVVFLLNHLAHPTLKISRTQLLMPGNIQEALTITGLAVGPSDGFLTDNSGNVRPIGKLNMCWNPLSWATQREGTPEGTCRV